MCIYNQISIKNDSFTRHLDSSGFTLIELMVAIAVFALLITFGIPSFNSLISSQTSSATASRLAKDLVYTRSEAVTRSRGVTICASDDGAACNATTTWTNGWIVFVDEDTDGVVDADDTLLRYEDVDSLEVGLAGNVAFVIYNRFGETLAAAQFDTDGRDAEGRERRVSVNNQGSVSISLM